MELRYNFFSFITTFHAKKNPLHGKTSYATQMQNDDNTILCLSSGFGAEQNPKFSKQDFSEAEAGLEYKKLAFALKAK